MKKVQKTMLLTALCILGLLNLQAGIPSTSNDKKEVSIAKQAALYYQVFRATGEFLAIVKVNDPADLQQQVKRFGKGIYICVGTGRTAIADRRIIVY